MNVSLTVWAVTVGVIAVLLIVDLFTVSAKPHEVKFKEAAGWSAFYIGIAIGKNHIGTIAGKLNGLMIPTTPSG